MSVSLADELTDHVNELILDRRISLQKKRRSKRMSISGDSTCGRDSFVAQLSLLTHLRTPNDEFEALMSHQCYKGSADNRIENLLEKFFLAEREVIQWIHEARVALIALQAEDPEVLVATTPLGQDPEKEVEKVIHHFVPRVKFFVDLRDLILQLVNSDEEKEDIDETADRAIAQWQDVKMQLESLKISFSSVKQDRNAVEEIEELMGEIADIADSVFEVQEQRHLDGLKDTEICGVSPTSSPPSTSNYEEILMLLDSQIESLTPRMDSISTHLTGFQSPAITSKYNDLLKTWNNIRQDVQILADELKEDKWIVVFRSVSEQANSMIESLERAIAQCQQYTYRSLHEGKHLEESFMLISRSTYLGLVKSFEAKRKYYIPAVERVIGILQKGIQDRVTKNGKILTSYHDLLSRWNSTKDHALSVESNMASFEDLQAAGAISTSPSSSLASSPPTTPSRAFSPDPIGRRESSSLRRIGSLLNIGNNYNSSSPLRQEHTLSVDSSHKNGRTPSSRTSSPLTPMSRSKSPRSPLEVRPKWDDSQKVVISSPAPLSRSPILNSKKSSHGSLSPSNESVESFSSVSAKEKSVTVTTKPVRSSKDVSSRSSRRNSQLPRPSSILLSSPMSSKSTAISPPTDKFINHRNSRRPLSPMMESIHSNGPSPNRSPQVRNVVRSQARYERPSTPEFAVYSRANKFNMAFPSSDSLHANRSRNGAISPASTTSTTPSHSNVGRYIPDKTDEVDIEVARIVNNFLEVGIHIPVERIGEKRYVFYGRGNNRPMQIKVSDYYGQRKGGGTSGPRTTNEKIKKVMVKLGGLMGGFVDLEMWLLDNK